MPTYSSNKYVYKEWFYNGQHHRDNDMPAVIDNDINYYYYVHGKKHRDNDMPAVIEPLEDNHEWYNHGELHRENDKPAIISSNLKEWYYKGRKHRDDNKPSYICDMYNDGTLFLEWYIHGTLIVGNDGDYEKEMNSGNYYSTDNEYVCSKNHPDIVEEILSNIENPEYINMLLGELQN
jgi:hypothetical protein